MTAEDEARYLYASLFAGRSLPHDVAARYAAATALCIPGASPLMMTLAARRLDAEAVEIALRRRQRSAEMTRRIQILFYLLEARSAWYPFFADAGKGTARAIPVLAWAVLRSAWKKVKGEFLVRRYALDR